MEKIAVFSCVSKSIRYLFNNIRSISLLVLQAYVITIAVTLLLSQITGINILTPNIDPFQESPPLSTYYPAFFIALLSQILWISFKVSIPRQIILQEPFDSNLLRLTLQKRYWYCLWATLKLWVAVALTYLLVVIALIIVFAIFAFLYGVLSALINEEALSGIEDYLGILVAALIVVFFFLLQMLVVAIFIYIPLFAAIDKKASLGESRKLTKGNRFRIAMILFFIYSLILLPSFIIMFPTAYLTSGSLWKQPFWLPYITNLIVLYLGTLMPTSIAFSYLSLTTGSVKKLEKES